MIKNDRQYRITKAQAARFSQTLNSLRQGSGAAKEVHPLIAKAQEDALSSQLADLESEMREYESLKAGEFQLDELNVFSDLPTVLIKARIAQGLSQKDLAQRDRCQRAANTAVRGHRLLIGQSSSSTRGRQRLIRNDRQACSDDGP